MIFTNTTPSIEPRLSADKGGEIGSASLPSAPVPSLREKFNAIAVRIIINGQSFDVAVPHDTINVEWEEQVAIAEKIGGGVSTPYQNEAVANYLLDREAHYLLAREQAGTITKEQQAVLSQHRAKWLEDPAARDRSEKAGAITDKEAALLNTYRMNLINDSEGGLIVDEACVYAVDSSDYGPYEFVGALVTRLATESN